MNRQLYAEGGIKSLLDIIASNPDKFGDILNILENVPREFMGGPYMGRPPKRNKRMPEEKLLEEFRDTRPVPRTENNFMRRYRQGRPEMKPETDEEVMERLMELQRRPEYQYDEENMYEGPRDMRMGGGIIKGLKGVKGSKGISKLARKTKDDLDEAYEMVTSRSDFEFDDYKMRGQLMAEELAEIRFKKDFDDLDQNTQLDLYQESSDYLNNVAADAADNARDMMKERFGKAEGGIMSIPRQQYGFGSFVSSIAGGIGDVLGGAADVVGDIVEEPTKYLDPIAQVASFIPGPHQPFAAAYTGARGSGIGGSDYGGFQIGGFTPSGSMFGTTSTTGPSFSPFQAGPGQAPSGGDFFDNINISDVTRIASQFQDTRQGGGGYGQQDQQQGGIADILGKVIQGGVSLYGAKKSYDDQKRINEAQQREYENFIRRQEEARKRYQTGEGLRSMDVRNRFREKADVVARPGVMGGGMMDLDVRTNPQGVKEIDYRKKGGFVPPIGIKEKADDIPAMLSNNEFVFTADAVRGAGKGSVNEGAKKMYALMKKLEAGGKA